MIPKSRLETAQNTRSMNSNVQNWMNTESKERKKKKEKDKTLRKLFHSFKLGNLWSRKWSLCRT